MIRAIRNNVLFSFDDEVTTRGEFRETHSTLYVSGSFDKSAKLPRWGTVVATGPECKFLRAGDKILISALRWSEGASYENTKVWKTDEQQLIAYERDGLLTLVNDFVAFRPIERAQSRINELIIIETVQPDTATGTIVTSSSDGQHGITYTGRNFYYDDSLFFDEIVRDGQVIRFIKIRDILGLVE